MAGQLPSDFGSQFENEDRVVGEAISTLRQREEDLAAIKAGLEDMKAGRYRPPPKWTPGLAESLVSTLRMEWP